MKCSDSPYCVALSPHNYISLPRPTSNESLVIIINHNSEEHFWTAFFFFFFTFCINKTSIFVEGLLSIHALRTLTLASLPPHATSIFLLPTAGNQNARDSGSLQGYSPSWNLLMTSRVMPNTIWSTNLHTAGWSLESSLYIKEQKVSKMEVIVLWPSCISYN